MNFEFIRECRLESDELQAMYDNVLQELERAEHYYWRKPQECGIILRQTTERICRIYNTYYQIGYPGNASLEEFLCYTDENEHNVMVSRFLSVVRKEQRDRLNKLRVLGDDCIWGEEAPDQGMTFEDRMGQNARHMMETMMEVTKDMCEKINKRDDVFDEFFLEEALPETKEEARKRGACRCGDNNQCREYEKIFVCQNFPQVRINEKISIDRLWSAACHRIYSDGVELCVCR